MNFRILGLPADDFTHFFELSDIDLATVGGVRRTAARLQASIFVALVAMLAQPGSARADQLTPRSGMYEITVRLELPHVERWAVDQTVTICLPATKGSGEIPVPVLSANNPFAKCAATNLTTNGATLQYDIICPGRGAAKAHAIYTLAADTFAGRVMMVMGGKNMTMTELQRGRRRGDCGPLELESDQTSPYGRKRPR
jgi:hypothetical protein